MGYRIGLMCSVGIGPERGGRTRNEDNFLVCNNGKVRYLEAGHERSKAGEGDGMVVAVCDGMGGHEDGHVASLTATKVMSRLYKPGVPSNPERTLLRYVKDSHRALHWKAAEAGPVTMGTTLTIAWLLHGTVSWVSVGDSRLYRLRQDQLELLTRDHTRNEFARRDGTTMVPDEGNHLAQNFIYGSRGLGDNANIRLEPGIDSGTLPLEAGDRLLLCSDGLWAHVDAYTISTLMWEKPDPQASAFALTKTALDQGATDNITAIVIHVDEQAPPKVQWTDDFDVLTTVKPQG